MLPETAQPVDHPFAANRAAIEYVFPEPIAIDLPAEQQVERILAEGRCAAWNDHLVATLALSADNDLRGSRPQQLFAAMNDSRAGPADQGLRENLYDFVKNRYFRDGVIRCHPRTGDERLLDTRYYGYIANGALERMMLVFNDDAEEKAPGAALSPLPGADALNRLAAVIAIEHHDECLADTARALCELTGADAAMIASTRVQGEAVCVQPESLFCDGQALAGQLYTLRGSPCVETLHRGFAVYSDELGQHFPDAACVKHFKARSYMGLALYGEYHRPIGLIALLQRSPLRDVATARALLRLVAPRAREALDSRRAKEIINTYERQRDFIEHNASGMYVIDIQPPLPVDLPINQQVKWIAENGVCIDCNAALLNLFGADSKHQVVGPNAVDINEVYDFGGMARYFVSHNYRLQDEIIKSVDLKGHSRWISTTATGYVEDNSLCQILGVLTDVTERVRYTRTIEYQANHDELTGLPNRKHFIERLSRHIQSAGDDMSCALFILDLDGFKEVNDTLGHDIGDELLRAISARLHDLLTPIQAQLARLGGDEFAVLINRHCTESDIVEIATELMGAMRQPYDVHDLELAVTGSLGVALFPYHGSSVSALMRCADVAMYQAKRNSVDYRIYAPEQDYHTLRRLDLMMDIRHAIGNDELVLYYQPIVDVGTLEVLGFEALVRWQHPKHGLLSPGEFIPLIELTDLVLPMTWWVVETAVKQLAQWQAQGRDHYIAVNIATRNLADSGFAERIRLLLQDYRVDGRLLECEITESSLMRDPEKARQVLMAVADLGVKISIDDYGTGYSSLAYLKSLPIDTLKIDRSFISQMLTNNQDRIIVNSTVQLAHNLGMGVTAEGIENRELVRVLGALNCDRGQGYHICRPVPVAELEQWLDARYCQIAR